jgi:hypothetical protein
MRSSIDSWPIRGDHHDGGVAYGDGRSESCERTTRVVELVDDFGYIEDGEYCGDHRRRERYDAATAQPESSGQ